jgi:hypothetical protein
MERACAQSVCSLFSAASRALRRLISFDTSLASDSINVSVGCVAAGASTTGASTDEEEDDDDDDEDAGVDVPVSFSKYFLCTPTAKRA